MPTRMVLALGLILLTCAVRAADAPVPPAKLELEPPDVEPTHDMSPAEVLQRWKAKFTNGRRPGSLAFRRVRKVSLDKAEKESLCRLDWDGMGNWQISATPLPNAAPLQADHSEVWGLTSNAVLGVNLDGDEFESHSLPAGVVRRGPAANWWQSISGFIYEKLVATPILLAGPGWPGAPVGWDERWNWTILKQDAKRIVLLAKPIVPAEATWKSEVRWIIERPAWKTWGVRVVDPSGNRITTWYRADNFVPPGAVFPLLSTDRLEAAGFRNVSLTPEEREAQSRRPADALVPRNTLVP